MKDVCLGDDESVSKSTKVKVKVKVGSKSIVVIEVRRAVSRER